MIAVVGTRGFPDVQGGVERHCEELYTRLAARGFDLLVFTRSPYTPAAPSSWRGIRFRRLWAPRRQTVEALYHSVAAVLGARRAGARVVHVHAIGPGLAVPLAHALGLRVVFTHHGRDYLRDKWGATAKRVLRTGERCAVRSADEVLAVSREVEAWVGKRFGRQAIYAPNGISVVARTPAAVQSTLARFGLPLHGYAVVVARLVPEKGLHDLMRAVEAAPDVGVLVVVGDADHRSQYATDLRANAPQKVRFIGAQPHAVTLDLVRGARLFVLPSYHEGLPIALLEALACGTPSLASNIEPNREVISDRAYGWLVPPGDVPALGAALSEVWALDEKRRQTLAAEAAAMVGERFSWERCADAVARTYRALGE
jgi:starch synthase